MPMNVIIIAAIVLVVLIVLWSIFTGRMGVFSKGLAACKGTCIPRDKCQAIDPKGACNNQGLDKEESNVNGKTITWFSPPDQNVVCCLL